MLKMILCSFLIFTAIPVVSSENDHDHKDKQTQSENEKGHDDHGDEHKDEHKDEHGEAHDDHGKEAKLDGFKLNVKALKTFEIKTIKFVPQKTLISKSAIYKGLNEINLYRLRDGLFKRIDFKTVSQDKNEYLIASVDLKAGDEVVINGIGFLRMAEIAASGGLSDSHSH